MRQYINQQLYPGEFLLHQKYCHSEMLLDLVWTHSNVVTDIAMQLYEAGKFDTSNLPREYVIQAGLLFEIGMYGCQGFEHFPGQPPMTRPYVQHGIIGAWILHREGYSPQVIQVAHAHMGVGISSQDITSYGVNLPSADYLAFTKLQQLIMYAAKFHSKAPSFKNREEIITGLERYGKEKTKIFEDFEKTFGEPNLSEVVEKYKQWHQGMEYQIQQLTGSTSLNQPAAGPAYSVAGLTK